MTLINDEIQSINCEHNHLPMFEVEAEYLTSVHQLKQVCSSISIQEVKRRYEQIHQHLDQKYGRKILTPYWRSWSSIRTTFNKIQSTNKCETIAKNASNIKLAPQLTVISNNQSFFRDYNVDNSPFMIFMSDEAKECLSESEQWDFDGTFRSTPTIFKQIFIVIAIYKNNPIHCAHLFLYDKEQETYTRAIKSLIKHVLGVDNYKAIVEKKKQCQLAIKTASADFESGIQNSIHIAFNDIKNIEIKGCWFHFTNAIIKRINQL